MMFPALNASAMPANAASDSLCRVARASPTKPIAPLAMALKSTKIYARAATATPIARIGEVRKPTMPATVPIDAVSRPNAETAPATMPPRAPRTPPMALIAPPSRTIAPPARATVRAIVHA